MADPGLVVALRPLSVRAEDLHAWVDTQRGAGAEAFLVVAVNRETGEVELREFGHAMHGSVLATVAMIVQARAIVEFKPTLADDPEG